MYWINNYNEFSDISKYIKENNKYLFYLRKIINIIKYLFYLKKK